MLLTDQSIKSLRKPDLIQYAIEITKLANRVTVNDSYEFVKNPKIKVEIKKDYISSEKEIRTTVNEDSNKVTYKIKVKIMNQTQIKISTNDMTDTINVDNALASLINEKGLTNSIAIYIISSYVGLGNAFCFDVTNS